MIVRVNSDPGRLWQELAPQALVVGCGFLGLELGRLLRECGVRVIATTRTGLRHPRLRAEGLAPYAVDLERPDQLSGLLDNLADASLDVFFLVPPSALRVPGDGDDPLPRLVSVLNGVNVRRAILASSTAVYGDRGGARVSAETPVSPAGSRAARLYSIELAWAEGDADMRVVRFAGLYGPGRIIGQSMLAAGEALGGNADDWLNLIHVSDAARLLLACARTQTIAGVELGCDGEPVKRGEYYAFIADELGVPRPNFTGAYSGQRGSRRCDPASTAKRTGWAPSYRNYKQGVRASLDEG